MKLLTRTKFIGPIGLIVATAGASALAAPEEDARSPEAASKEAAPTQCPGLEEPEATLEDQSATSHHDAEAQREVHGPLALIGAALEKVCLDDDQRAAIEKLGDEVRPKEEAVMAARHALRSALVEQLKKGEIDGRALNDDVEKVVAAREDASPVLRKALEDLHGILDAGQRAAFVDALRARIKELGKGADGDRLLDKLADDLKLSDDQKKKIGDVLAKAKPHLEEEHARVSRVLDAFEKDEFSMEKIAPVGEVGERTRERVEGMLGIAKELASILSPEQRVELATRIEAKMAKRGHHGATTSAEEDAELDEAQQPIIVARGGGFRAGGVRGWGGGGYVARGGYVGGVRGGYVGGARVVTTGYAAGYPLVPGYGPGVW